MSNMMQGWYVPTTEDVCSGFRGDPRKFDQAGEPIDAIGSNYGSKCYAAFHRWLKEHDERIRREALTLSNEESDIGSDAIADFFASPGDEVMFEIPTRDMLDAAIEAISESRERES
jgi:hypothetical protein